MKNVVLILFLFSLSYAATYYVSSSGGSDSYTPAEAQNQATPWQSLAKVNAQTFAPGDNILFKRGDVWEGGVTVSASGASGAPITYGAYGTGENPNIKGTIVITATWTPYSGTIYQAQVATNIHQLFLNGKPLTLARHPNSGYLTQSDTINSTTLSCTALTSTDWTGATAHIRTSHWTIASKTITACNVAQKTLTLSAAPVYGLKPGWGFFINNALAALDTAGEWFYDSLSKKLYVWTPNGTIPSNFTVEGTVANTGFTINNKVYVSVTGFSITGHWLNGIRINNSSNTTISGNSILYPDGHGINIGGNGQNNTVSGNFIAGANTYGIVSYGTGNVFSGNTIKNIALIRRLNKSGLGDQTSSGLAAELHGNKVSFANNVIDSIGYIGVRSFDADNSIEYNLISNCCMTKDDGAGIYTGWQSTSTETGAAGTVIRRNIVLNSHSAPQGTPDVGYFPGEGIYVDDHGHDITIEENTTAYCPNNGIFLHNNKNIVVRNNVSYNNSVQFRMAEDAIVGPGYTGNNLAKNNVLYSLTENQTCFSTTSSYTDSVLGVTDSNYYCNPYSDIIITYNASAYALETWCNVKKMDAHSKISLVQMMPYVITDTLGSNLINNPTFDNGIAGWSFWPAPVKISWNTSSGLDAGCMKVLYTDDSQSASCLVYPSSFALTADQAYLLSYSAISNKTGTLQAIARQAHTPWGTLGLSKSFIVGKTRKEFSVVFTATATDAQSRVDFSNTKADSLYWLDNVTIVPVSFKAENPAEKSVLMYNATMSDQIVSLAGKVYRDLDGNRVTGNITLQRFRSRVLVLDTAQVSINDFPAGKNNLNSYTLLLTNMNGSLKIRLQVLATDNYSLRVYDIRGRLVTSIYEGILNKGAFTFCVNDPLKAQGTCFLHIQAGNAVLTKKIFVAR